MRCFSYIVTTILVTMNPLKEVLKQKGIKQIWLWKMGKSYPTINEYEKNKRKNGKINTIN